MAREVWGDLWGCQVVVLTLGRPPDEYALCCLAASFLGRVLGDPLFPWHFEVLCFLAPLRVEQQRERKREHLPICCQCSSLSLLSPTVVISLLFDPPAHPTRIIPSLFSFFA